MADDQPETTETENRPTASQAVHAALRELSKDDEDVDENEALSLATEKGWGLTLPMASEGLDLLLRRGECYYPSDGTLRLVEPVESEDDHEIASDGGMNVGTVGVSVAEFVRRAQASTVTPPVGVPRSHVLDTFTEDALTDAERRGEVFLSGNRVKVTNQ